ncbi:MAG TPA: DNA recombination protein RmuC [Bryobacteraceae bacterium]|jgi:DNA recombination protein RmuC
MIQFSIAFVCFLAGIGLSWLFLMGRVTALKNTLDSMESERGAERERQALLEQRINSLTAKEADASARLETERAAARLAQTLLEDQLRTRNSELGELRDRASLLSVQKVELETRAEVEKESIGQQIRLLQQAEDKLTLTFKAISKDVLSQNSETFLDLAKAKLSGVEASVCADLAQKQLAIDALVSPVRTSLAQVDEKIQQLERAREGAYSELRQQVRSLGEGQMRLQAETGKLVTALRSPIVRGRWGEIQLKRVVEMAGMLDRCDFDTQRTVHDQDGSLRPDLVVNLPGGKSIVVDAKTPIEAYLQALEAGDDELRKDRMIAHARHVRMHISALGKKSYFEQFQPSPDFVVLFLPGESFYSAALESDPTLIEFGTSQNVLLATPTTLIALLRTAAYGWQQDSLAANAAKIRDLGKQLHDQIRTMTHHWNGVGSRLQKAVDAYNRATNSLETRVLVSARRLEELEVVLPGRELGAALPVEGSVPRLLAAVAGASYPAVPSPVDDEA